MAQKIRTVSRKAATPVIPPKTAPRHIRVNKTAANAEKPKTLHFFQFTPRGLLCRAYFFAMIIAQVGVIKAGVIFKLWPGANLTTHVKAGKLKYLGEGKYQLTAAGATYFNDDEQKPEKEQLVGMLKAVKHGERPKFWPKELSEMRV